MSYLAFGPAVQSFKQTPDLDTYFRVYLFLIKDYFAAAGFSRNGPGLKGKHEMLIKAPSDALNGILCYKVISDRYTSINSAIEN